MQAQIWGIKTFYYSLINKQGSKAIEQLEVPQQVIIDSIDELEDDCEACKL
jgi:hypothetical protein